MLANDTRQLGAVLRQRRRDLGFTQDEIASVIGVNRRVVGELERGKGTVRLEIALAAARSMGLNIDLRIRQS